VTRHRDPYAKFAAGYDARWATFGARTHARVLGQLPPELTGKRLRDVGCGTGTLIKRPWSAIPPWHSSPMST